MHIRGSSKGGKEVGGTHLLQLDTENVMVRKCLQEGRGCLDYKFQALILPILMKLGNEIHEPHALGQCWPLLYGTWRRWRETRGGVIDQGIDTDWLIFESMRITNRSKQYVVWERHVSTHFVTLHHFPMAHRVDELVVSLAVFIFAKSKSALLASCVTYPNSHLVGQSLHQVADWFQQFGCGCTDPHAELPPESDAEWVNHPHANRLTYPHIRFTTSASNPHHP